MIFYYNFLELFLFFHQQSLVMQTTCRKKIHKTGNDIIERTPADTHECGLLNTFYDKARFVQIVINI